MFAVLFTILGLAVFEVISSIDNAVVNAEVLGTMRDQKARRFFATWGIFFAVFVVRGVLPLLIVYAASPSAGISGAFAAMFSGNTTAKFAIEMAAPCLLTAGGTFLILLFAHWLFVEEKEFGLPHESLFTKIGQVWFYGIAALILLGEFIVLHHLCRNAEPMMLAAAIGSTAFFMVGGVKEHAEAAETKMKEDSSLGDWSKVLFLEVIDMSFSVDGVVGAFAFTTAVPLILIGNGIGAVIVRQLTLGNVERIKKYPLVKNGAMYSIGALACIMITEGFGAHVPAWVSPVMTFAIIGAHLLMSIRNQNQNASS